MFDFHMEEFASSLVCLLVFIVGFSEVSFCNNCFSLRFGRSIFLLVDIVAVSMFSTVRVSPSRYVFFSGLGPDVFVISTELSSLLDGKLLFPFHTKTSFLFPSFAVGQLFCLHPSDSLVVELICAERKLQRSHSFLPQLVC